MRRKRQEFDHTRGVDQHLGDLSLLEEKTTQNMKNPVRVAGRNTARENSRWNSQDKVR